MRPRTAALLLAVALLATSCFKSETRIHVNDDGSGRVDALIALDVDAALELGNMFATEDTPELTEAEACSEFEADQDVPEGATVEPYDQDGFCGMSYSVDFEPGGLEEAFTDSATGGDFELRRDGDGWYFESVLTSDDGSGDLGTEFMPSGILDDAELSIGVNLPGRQVEHNASYIDSDGTMVWELDITAEDQRIFARTEAGDPILGSGSGGGSSIVGLILIVLVLALIGGGIWLIVKRRREGDAAARAGLPGQGPDSVGPMPDVMSSAPDATTPGPPDRVPPPPPAPDRF